jgi:hypothetical protein
MRLLVLTAVVLLIGLVVFFVNRESGSKAGVAGPDGTAARSTVVLDAEGAAKRFITVYEPVDGAKVRLADLTKVTFRWSGVPGADRYSFVANNEVGQLVWRSNVTDTTLVLPEKVANTLLAGERIKWLVQVQGLSASTDLNRLVIE